MYIPFDLVDTAGGKQISTTILVDYLYTMRGGVLELIHYRCNLQKKEAIL